MSFLKLFKKFDYFGVRIQFRMDKSERYTTVAGGIVTSIMVILSLIYIGVSSKSFFERENINLLYTSKTIENTPNLNLSKLGFNFAIDI